jgi:hypothetical protein
MISLVRLVGLRSRRLGYIIANRRKPMRLKLFIAFLFVGTILLVFHQSAAAHGHIQVGDYDLVIGFHNEPTYQGEPNGLDLFVTNTKTGEKVNGLEETLKAELIFGSSKKEFELEPQEDVDGAYTAYVIPTDVGDYTWHIFGNIEGTPVDVSMTSAPDTFGSVEPKADYSFPNAEASAGELTSQTASAASTARTALVAGVIGVVLGLAGLVVGGLGFQAARRRSM